MDREKLLKQLEAHENEWVAIREEDSQVVASGSDATEAHTKARQKGQTDVRLLKVLPFESRYIPRL